MIRASKEFGGCADGRSEVSVVPDHLIQSPDDLRVGNVFAVPCQKIVDSVPRSNGNVSGIRSGLFGNDSAFENLCTQFDSGVINFENGQAFDCIEALTGRLGVTSPRFFDDQLGDEHGIMALAGIPPAEGELLLSRKDQVV